MAEKIIANFKRRIARGKLLFVLVASIVLFVACGCHIEGISCCDESGLASGIHQIANGVIDIIDYFD